MRALKFKEPVNTLTHLVPCIAAMFGLGLLVWLSGHNLSKLVTMTIYGVSVILLYTASSVYHGIKTTPQKELLLRKLDHIAIYVLIAGSYTPVFYYGLSGYWKWIMLAAVWTLAVLGMILKIWFIQAPRYVSTVFYVTLGWIALVPFLQLIHNLPIGAIVFMVMGGVMYTLGAVIYAAKIFNLPKLGFHGMFHLFVAAGTILHFVMMLIYIMPK